MKILCTGDLHIDEKLFDQKTLRQAYINMNERLTDNSLLNLESQYPSLVEIVESSKNVDLVVILGDVFGLDDNHYSTIAERTMFTDFITRIDKPIYVLYGNHEVAHDLDYFSKFKHVAIITSYFEDDTFKLMAFPSHVNKEDIERFFKPSNKILFTHAMFAGANLGNKEAKYDARFTFPSKYDKAPGKLIIAGHVHIPQTINNFIYYVGSTNRFNYGEVDEEKSFIILDTDTLKINRIPLKLVRKLYQFESKFENGKFIPELPETIPPLSKLKLSVSEKDMAKLPYNILSAFHKVEYINTTPKERKNREDLNILKGNSLLEEARLYLQQKIKDLSADSIKSILNKIETLSKEG